MENSLFFNRVEGPYFHKSATLKVRKNLLEKLKYAFPLIALLALFFGIIWPQLWQSFRESNPSKEEVKPLSTLEEASQSCNSVINPQFDAVDKAGRPFQIKAKEGIEREEGKLEFEKPSVLMPTQSGDTVSVTALSGLWKRQEQALLLKGNVELQHSSGLHLQSESVTVDLATGSAQGQERLTGEGPLGKIEASGFQFKGKDQTIILLGRPSLTFSFSDKGLTPKERRS